MSSLRIAGGRVIDPANNTDGLFDVVFDQGKIVAVEPSGKAGKNGATVVDAKGKLVLPGLVDIHTHLRQPGREDKETIASGLRAAIRGGFTSVCAMPNTDPAIDQRGVVDFIHQEGARCGLARVRAVGAVTKGREGKELTDFGELFDAGCVALSDDGSPVVNSLLMRRALEYATLFGRPLIQHAEEPSLVAGGVMHEGEMSTVLGLRGMPSEAESVMVARDVALAELTGGWVHFGHLSRAASVALVRHAKARGVRVTAEVTPHHLALTEAAVEGFNAYAKCNPPLRTEQDRLGLIEGLRDGTIDCIATDHAPHTDWEKQTEFDAAPFGISGLETALSVCVESLITSGALTWPQLVETLTVHPARIAGLEAGTLSVGAPADIVLVDPDAVWTVDPARFASKGRNSPFAGKTLPATVLRVWRDGLEVSDAC